MGKKQRKPAERRTAEAPKRPPLAERLGRRIWLLRLALAVGVPVLMLGLLELGLRAGGFGYPTDLALPVPGHDNLGSNLRFGWRFFPRQIARAPLAFAFDEEKPENTVRIFVLGASAAQGYPRGAFGFSRILEAMLAETYPETNFEVINTAIVATNSHVVLPIARECAAYDPDLFIVYLGNNEVIGPYGLGASRSGVAGRLNVVRAGIALRTTRIGQLLQQLTAGLAGQDEELQQWGGMSQFMANNVRRDAPELRQVRDNFAANLEDICLAASERDVPTVLCTVAVNDWDSSPFASLHDPDLSEQDLAAWQAVYTEACTAAGSGRSADALALFARAAEIDDSHAELSFRQGSALLALGDTLAAAPHFVRARELDVLRFRTDDALNDVIRMTAGALDDVHLVDVAEVFTALGPDLDLPRQERRFFEHVHLTYAGNDRLARTVFSTVVSHLPATVRGSGDVAPQPPGRQACADRLNYTVWDEVESIRLMLTLMQEPPFPNQFDQPEMVADWQAIADSLQAGLDHEGSLRVLHSYRQAIKRRPDDLLLRMNLVRILRMARLHREATSHLRYIEMRQPPVDWIEAEPGGH